MTITAIMVLVPVLLGLGAIETAAADDGPRVRSLVVRDQLILKVPLRPPPGRVDWVERDGPKCVHADAIRGAFLSGPHQVDFLVLGGRRVRAKLSDDCPALDFYEGFYLSPEDSRVCAGREAIRSRIGGSCEIERFQLLVPRRRE